nr:hypothetical protein [Tanacetum cinerariifolium]
MKSSFSNTEERGLQELQERISKMREDCSFYFEIVKKHLKYLQTIRWNGWGAEEGFGQAIRRYFGDNRDTFSKKLSYNIDNLQRQIEKEFLHEESTKDNTSTEKQDESSSSEHVVDAETTRVDKGVSDIENTDVGPSYDKNTLNESQVRFRALVGGFVSFLFHSVGFGSFDPGSESRTPMLNKENYVPWSSRLHRYAKSRPNGKLIHNSILNGPYVRRTIPEPSDANREVTVTETFHVQTGDELSDKELKQIEADDQAI